MFKFKRREIDLGTEKESPKEIKEVKAEPIPAPVPVQQSNTVPTAPVVISPGLFHI